MTPSEYHAIKDLVVNDYGAAIGGYFAESAKLCR